MTSLDRRLAALADEGFAGVVRLDVHGETVVRTGVGLADRARGVAMTPETRLAVASGSKTFTALAVLALVEDGALSLGTTARSVLGADLPLVDDDVTLEHLLSHRSGIGDYLDESSDDYDESAYLMPVPAHALADAEDYLPVLDGFPMRWAAGTRYEYCNGSFCILAIIAERTAGLPFHDLVQQRVLDPAGLAGTAYLRSDALPGDAALGYLQVGDEWRTNVHHLPVRGGGDGGAFTTVDDLHRFWPALLGGQIIGAGLLEEMVRPRSEWDEHGESYGLGIRLDRDSGALMMRGGDTGVSFTSVHASPTGTTLTVIGNTSGNAWPVLRALAEHLGW